MEKKQDKKDECEKDECENPDTDELIMKWDKLNAEISLLKAKEMEWRKLIASRLFTEDVREGVNTYPLGNGYKLKMTHKLNRKLDDAVGLVQTLLANKIPADNIVKYKPELSIKGYRDLTQEQIKLVDQFLTISPAAPTLELVGPTEGEKI